MMLNIKFLAIFGEANASLAATQCQLRKENQSDPELTLVYLSFITKRLLFLLH